MLLDRLAGRLGHDVDQLVDRDQTILVHGLGQVVGGPRGECALDGAFLLQRRDDQHRLTDVQNALQTLLGSLAIERHVSPAGFEDAQHRGDHFRAPLLDPG